MRALGSGAALVLAVTSVLAAPIPEANGPRRPAAPPIGRQEVRDYAALVRRAAEMIAQKYIDPIPEEQLVAAALVGLYDAVHLPRPDGLRDPASLRGRELEAELERYRQELGNPPALQGDQAVRISLNAMTRLLDPYCAYLAPEEALQAAGDQAGRTGLQYEERNRPGPLYVRSVVPGSPAFLAGLRPGDAVLEVDGRRTADWNARQALSRTDGPENSTVRLLVQAATGQASRAVEVSRDTFKEPDPYGILGVHRRDDETWDYWIDPARRIAHVRLNAITSSYLAERNQADGRWTTQRELQTLLTDLTRAGLAGLVLDLRDLPIGLVQESIQTAGLFLDGQALIATVRNRNPRTDGQPSGPQHNPTPGPFCHLPLAVLVSPDTSGAGELIAAALQDHKRAVLVGQRTRGKDSIQVQEQIESAIAQGGHALRLSTGVFIRPSGVRLGRRHDSKASDPWGVRPDVEVRVTDGLRRQVRRWRFDMDLRTPGDRAVLALDDPANDPVLYAALNHLRRELDAKAPRP